MFLPRCAPLLFLSYKRPSMHPSVFVLGSFAVDASFRAPRLPVLGETLLGSSFALGPGGKGSNQAVAAARAGGHVFLLTAIGKDTFGEIARSTWAAEGIDTSLVKTSPTATGSAAILLNETTGENAIIVVPGACSTLTAEDVENAAEQIGRARVFVTQLETPLPVVQHGLALARAAGITTVLNPAPAPRDPLPAELLSLVDYLLPNQTEAAQITGLPVDTPAQLQLAALSLIERGVKNVLFTLGERGALLYESSGGMTVIPAVSPGPVVDTTGAGDAFCGAFASSLREGQSAIAAGHFASAAAGLSVTKHGAASSMPHRREIDHLLRHAPATT